MGFEPGFPACQPSILPSNYVFFLLAELHRYLDLHCKLTVSRLYVGKKIALMCVIAALEIPKESYEQSSFHLRSAG